MHLLTLLTQPLKELNQEALLVWHMCKPLHFGVIG